MRSTLVLRISRSGLRRSLASGTFTSGFSAGGSERTSLASGARLSAQRQPTARLTQPLGGGTRSFSTSGGSSPSSRRSTAASATLAAATAAMSPAASSIGAAVTSGLGISAGIIISANVLGLLITGATRTHKVVDLLSAGPVAVVAVATFAVGNASIPSLILTGITVAWSVRLSWFLLERVRQRGSDKRFESFIPPQSEALTVSSASKLGAFFAATSLWGFTISLPTVVINSLPAAAVYAGTGVWVLSAVSLAGLAFEIVADRQKSAFRADLTNRDKVMDRGLWRYTRHPNYFGEIVHWTALWGASAVATLGGGAYLWWPVIVSAASPGFTIANLLLGSGVPNAEKTADGKYGGRADYERYKKVTSVLLPMPPKDTPASKNPTDAD